ncbi:MAG TPA: IS1595 family transposase [Acetobacteraceae bacterium]|nr:IS1595 family transposase [Acetobacteraceae bacterium]
MSQHFLLSARARTLSLGQVLRMSNEEAEQAFIRVRWPGGKPICPSCECSIVWDCRKANGTARWRCKACRKSFSITSGTIFAHRKMGLRNYLAAIAIFCNEVKGKSALALSRDLGVQYRTAFVLAHKLRESMASEMKGMKLGGQGETVEIDGMYAGGYVKPANNKENRRDRRLAKNQNGKRKVVVVVRERGGRTLPAVFKTEDAALGWINARVARDTRLMADEAPSWNDLAARYQVERINHQEAYSLAGGIYTNNAKSFFSRVRRGEIGHHHHISGPYLVRYAQESAWREDYRRVDNGRQVDMVSRLAMACRPSVDWSGYWQRHIRV